MSSADGLQALLFDLDGTLVDTVDDLTVSVNVALKALGRPLRTRQEIRGFIGDGAKQLVADALGPGQEALVDQGLDLFITHYDAHCDQKSVLYPGVAAVLPRLSGRKLAVVTNKPEAPSRLILKHLGILDFFETVVGGDTLPVKKPDPGPVLEACRRLDVAPGQAAMVGDSPGDMKAARAAGTQAIAVAYGYRPAQQLKDAGAQATVERFEDLLVLLKA